MEQEFLDVEGMRSKPIPSDLLREVRKTGGYRRIPILRNHPLHAEPCIDALAHGIVGRNYYFGSDDNPPYHRRLPHSMPEVFVRQSFIPRLRRINARLWSAGLEIFLLDGIRRPQLQRHLRHEFWPAYLSEQNPSWSGGQVEAEVKRWWSSSPATVAGIDPEAPAPHAVSAFSFLLKHRNGGFVPLGVSFDEMSDCMLPDAYEGALGCANPEVRANRRLLYWSLEQEGFSVSATTIFHASEGDQWAAQKRSVERGQPVSAYYSIADVLFKIP